jgi:hypothetical protein
MFSQVWYFLQFNFWLRLASLGAGLAVVAPCLLVPTWRRKILRSDIDIDIIGLIALIVAIVAIGCYNHFRASNGP